jgi:hypothetical protein
VFVQAVARGHHATAVGLSCSSVGGVVNELNFGALFSTQIAWKQPSRGLRSRDVSQPRDDNSESGVAISGYCSHCW